MVTYFFSVRWRLAPTPHFHFFLLTSKMAPATMLHVQSFLWKRLFSRIFRNRFLSVTNFPKLFRNHFDIADRSLFVTIPIQHHRAPFTRGNQSPIFRDKNHSAESTKISVAQLFSFFLCNHWIFIFGSHQTAWQPNVGLRKLYTNGRSTEFSGPFAITNVFSATLRDAINFHSRPLNPVPKDQTVSDFSGS